MLITNQLFFESKAKYIGLGAAGLAAAGLGGLEANYRYANNQIQQAVDKYQPQVDYLKNHTVDGQEFLNDMGKQITNQTGVNFDFNDLKGSATNVYNQARPTSGYLASAYGNIRNKLFGSSENQTGQTTTDSPADTGDVGTE